MSHRKLRFIYQKAFVSRVKIPVKIPMKMNDDAAVDDVPSNRFIGCNSTVGNVLGHNWLIFVKWLYDDSQKPTTKVYLALTSELRCIACCWHNWSKNVLDIWEQRAFHKCKTIPLLWGIKKDSMNDFPERFSVVFWKITVQHRLLDLIPTVHCRCMRFRFAVQKSNFIWKIWR